MLQLCEHWLVPLHSNGPILSSIQFILRFSWFLFFIVYLIKLFKIIFKIIFNIIFKIIFNIIFKINSEIIFKINFNIILKIIFNIIFKINFNIIFKFFFCRIILFFVNDLIVYFHGFTNFWHFFWFYQKIILLYCKSFVYLFKKNLIWYSGKLAQKAPAVAVEKKVEKIVPYFPNFSILLTFSKDCMNYQYCFFYSTFKILN